MAKLKRHMGNSANVTLAFPNSYFCITVFQNDLLKILLSSNMFLKYFLHIISLTVAKYTQVSCMCYVLSATV